MRVQNWESGSTVVTRLKEERKKYEEQEYKINLTCMKKRILR